MELLTISMSKRFDNVLSVALLPKDNDVDLS
jgi:hypothetical protein